MAAEAPSPRSATSASWRTSTPVRRRRPSGSCSTPVSPTRSVRSTRARPSWTGWSRSRSAASPSPPPRRSASGRATHPDHRHARPRRLHRRGRAVAARARRCGRGLRRCRRRGAADRERLAAGGQVQRPAHVLRQQARPHRCRLLPLRRHDDRPAQRHPAGAADPDRAEADYIGVVDLVEMRALTWRGETQKGEDYAIEEIPADLADQAAEYREKLLETLADVDDAIMEKYLEGEEHLGREAQGRHPPGHHRQQGQPGACRLGVQEQGRAAHARRRRRLPAVAAGHPGDRGHRDRRRDRGPAARRRERAVLRPGLQDPDGQAPRQADLRPGLLRHARLRLPGGQLHQGPQGADRQDLPDAREQA